MIRSGKWIEGEYGGAKRIEDDNDLSVFDPSCLKGIERVEIEDYCITKVSQFVIDGLNEMKSLVIGKNSSFSMKMKEKKADL